MGGATEGGVGGWGGGGGGTLGGRSMEPGTGGRGLGFFLESGDWSCCGGRLRGGGTGEAF